MIVFLSSTYLDLEAERKAVGDVLHRLKLTPLGMEYFLASTDKADRKSLDELSKADLVVVVLGYRYGRIVGKTGKSMVELEYDAARRWGKQILVFIREDDVAVLRDHVEVEHPEKLRRFKAKLDRNHTRQRFSHPEQLAKLVALAVIGCLQQRGSWLTVPFAKVDAYRRFWTPFIADGGTIVLEVGDKHVAHQGELEYAKNINGVRGIYELIPSLVQLGVKFRIDNAVDAGLRKGTNLILDGSPTGNTLTKEVVEQPQVKAKLRYVNGQSSDLYRRWLRPISGKGRRYKTRYEPSPAVPGGPDPKSRILQDYGYLTRITNPYDPSKTCLIASGNHGAGTYGCMRVLSSPEFLSEILDKAGDQEFQAIVSIHCRDIFQFSDPHVERVFLL